MIDSKEYYLFSDASYDPKLNIGIGATLLLAGIGGELPTDRDSLAIRTKVMESNSIARLELEAALWGLEQLRAEPGFFVGAKVTLLTDCQTIEKLLDRRPGLEARNFQSRATSKTLTNADVYQIFYAAYDELAFTVVWLKGHSPQRNQGHFERVFAQVDKAAREKLREYRATRAPG